MNCYLCRIVLQDDQVYWQYNIPFCVNCNALDIKRFLKALLEYDRKGHSPTIKVYRRGNHVYSERRLAYYARKRAAADSAMHECLTGAQLRALRLSRGLTIEGLAHTIGVHFSSIGHIEREQHKMPALRRRIVEVLESMEPVK